MNSATESSAEVVHSFSQPIAKQYGVQSAVVMSYLGHKIQASDNVRVGRRWYYTTYRELADQYPYLSLNAVYNAVQRLTSDGGPLLVGNYNSWKQDKTTWYAFKEPHYANQLSAHPRYFKCCDAVSYGLPEAVVLNNITAWIQKNMGLDGTRLYLAVSPQKLSEVLPFSRTTIQRSLDRLVEQRVLVVRTPEDRRKPNEYALATMIALGARPNTNKPAESLFVNEQQPKSDSCSNTNIGGPNRDIGGPDTNMGSPNTNNGGPDRDNITYCKDTYCEDSHLKEGCLKENHFKTVAAGSSSNSLPLAEASTPKLGTMSVRVLSSEDVTSSPVPEPTKQSQWDFSTSTEPHLVFLDPEVHAACWEVMMLHADHKEEWVEGMALAIVQAVKDLIHQTEPHKIQQMLNIRTQRESNAAVFEWAAQFLDDRYRSRFSTPAEAQDQTWHREFVRQGVCFINMSFHSLLFPAAPRLYFGSPHYHKIGVEVWRRMETYWENRRSMRLQQFLDERRAKFTSPDKHKEHDPSLSAAEKMHVFNQSLQSRNRIGRFDQFGEFTENVVQIHRNSMNLVRTFFQLNPEFTPADLNMVLDRCLELETAINDEDPLWHAKQAHKISFLVTNLSMIAAQLNVSSSMPAIVPLPYVEKEMLA